MKESSLEQPNKVSGTGDEFKQGQIIETDKGTLRIDSIQEPTPVTYATYESFDNRGQQDKLVFKSPEELRAFIDSLSSDEEVHNSEVQESIKFVPGQVVKLDDQSLHKVLAVQDPNVFIEALVGGMSQVVQIDELTPQIDDKGAFVYEEAFQTNPVDFAWDAEMTPENLKDLDFLKGKKGNGSQ